MEDRRTQLAGLRGIRDGPLTIKSRVDADVAVFELHGSLDLSTAGTLDRELRSMEKSVRPQAMVIDLTSLEFIDTTGLSKLLGAANRAHRGGRSLRVGGAGGQVARALEITGLSERLDSIG